MKELSLLIKNFLMYSLCEKLCYKRAIGSNSISTCPRNPQTAKRIKNLRVRHQFLVLFMERQAPHVALEGPTLWTLSNNMLWRPVYPPRKVSALWLTNSENLNNYTWSWTKQCFLCCCPCFVVHIWIWRVSLLLFCVLSHGKKFSRVTFLVLEEAYSILRQTNACSVLVKTRSKVHSAKATHSFVRLNCVSKL